MSPAVERRSRVTGAGLTFGTISATYGLNAGIIDRTQFSVLVTVVILSAIVPTAIAERVCSPPVRRLSAEEVAAVEDAEFEPPFGAERPA